MSIRIGMPSVGRLCLAASGLFLSRPPGVFLPGNRAPHAAVAFGDADVGDAVGHPPVAGRIGGQARQLKTCGEKQLPNKLLYAR